MFHLVLQPTAQDSARIKQSAEELKPEFAADTSAKNFLVRNSSAIDYFDGYTPKTKIQIACKRFYYFFTRWRSFWPIPGCKKLCSCEKSFNENITG